VADDSEIEKQVNARLAERIRAEEEKRWIGVVNAAVESINRHVVDDLAHPRLVAIVERATQATERMEQLVMAAAPEDIRRYLPALIDREKRHDEEQAERAAALKVLSNRITFGIPIATILLATVDFLLRLWGR